MGQIIDSKSARRLPLKFATGLAVAAAFALGTFTGSADAREYHQYRHHHYYGGGYYNGYYNGGYYRGYGGAYYGSPYYAPGIGVGLPGFNVGIW